MPALGVGYTHVLGERFKRVPAPSLTSPNDEITIRQVQYVRPEWVDFRVTADVRF
jgi:hypothetical protein